MLKIGSVLCNILNLHYNFSIYTLLFILFCIALGILNSCDDHYHYALDETTRRNIFRPYLTSELNLRLMWINSRGIRVTKTDCASTLNFDMAKTIQIVILPQIVN